jgi:hypothetical protein
MFESNVVTSAKVPEGGDRRWIETASATSVSLSRRRMARQPDCC